MKNVTNENNEYFYDAFISYRRVEPDQTVAKLVHKQLDSSSYKNHYDNLRLTYIEPNADKLLNTCPDPMLILVNSNMVSQIDMKTGDVLFPVYIGGVSNINYSTEFSSVIIDSIWGDSILYTGEFDIQYNDYYSLATNRKIKSLNNTYDDSDIANNTIIVLENSNQLLFFSNQLPATIADNIETIPPKKYDFGKVIYSENANEIQAESQRLNIPNSHLIDTIVYDNDEKYICVSYKTQTATMYSIEDPCNITPLCSWNTENSVFSENTSINKYCGMDNEGNIYWAGDEYGYCISSNYFYMFNLGWLKAVDSDSFILQYNDKNDYQVPILSTKELLNIAQEYLDDNNIQYKNP